jgi:hypothetical protein
MTNSAITLDRRYTREEVENGLDEDGNISGLVAVHINELIATNWDSFGFECSDMLIGYTNLKDVKWELYGVANGNVILKVTGNPEKFLST